MTTNAPAPSRSSLGILDRRGLGLIDDLYPCHVNDPELWFADEPDDLESAKALCAACPVQRACLAGALERGEPWGVWGGHLLERGVVIPRKRPRGRPRKGSVAA